MDRAASEMETELPDLSAAGLCDLDDGRQFTSVTRRLLELVESPPTLSIARDDNC
ncbi:hypothetical protein [Streptomyces radicis]|uniref:hypothetical protein n=1 Tax=Streptomyces radicis TaxID=1750517 RepID=UPI0016047B8B|nr:hypothetical protein [Streptomyces radicis]